MAETTIKEKVEDAAVADSQTKDTPKKDNGFFKTVIVLGVMQILIAAGVFVAIKFLILPKMPVSGEAQEETNAALVEKKEPGEIHLIENILVNPAGTNGTRYLSTSIGLEVAKSEESSEHFKEITPIVRDILIAVLSSKSLEDLGSAAGRDAIRKEILDRVNLSIAPDSVYKIYFVDYVLQ